jgi:hypothetical protein
MILDTGDMRYEIAATTCWHCDADIVFVKSERGKAIPLNPEPHERGQVTCPERRRTDDQAALSSAL